MSRTSLQPGASPAAYSPTSTDQRRRRLARVRLAEVVALRRAARSSSGRPPSAPAGASPSSAPAD